MTERVTGRPSHIHALKLERISPAADLLISAAQRVNAIVVSARWEILQELNKGEPLPLAEKLVIPQTANNLDVARLGLCAN